MTQDPIKAWLNAAGRFPQLPKAELLRLAKRRDSLAPGSKAYIKVVNKICEHNLLLIPSVVRTYVGKRNELNMSSSVVSDLLQQGYLGLRRAAEKFDATRGFTFSTYAYNWIRQSIIRWHSIVDKTIYVPENAVTEVLYRRRHGKPSTSKNNRLSSNVLNAATRVMEISSTDKRLSHEDDGTTVADRLSEENRITYADTDEEGTAIIQLRDLMAECGINPKAQDILLHYGKRGRMSLTASVVGIKQSDCRKIYNDTVEILAQRVKEKESARAALVADRLNRN